MRIYKAAFDTFPPEIKTALRAAAVENATDYDIPAKVFLQITAPQARPNPEPAGDVQAGLDAEIKRATGQTPCRGCGA